MTEAKKKDYRVGDDGFWARAWVTPLALAIVGGLIAVLTADADRLGYAYLFGLFTTATFMLGGLFLVLVQFLTASYWGVSSRRIVEVVMSGAPVVALLALPFIGGVVLGKINIYDEWQSVAAHGEHAEEHGTLELGTSVAHAQDDGDEHEGDAEEAAHEEEQSHTPQEAALHHRVLSEKTGFLNTNGWAARGLGYLIVWSLLAWLYFSWSRRQDQDHNPQHTVRMQSLAAPSLILFAATLTFAAFDWLMSLEAAWFSTIFGVIIFAGSAVSILALTILIGLSLYKRGLVGDAINTEHFHDLSRLMFGFVCFWSYVQFSQWMLIWYAGIPEEATWFHKRWEGGWQFVDLPPDLRPLRRTLPFAHLARSEARPSLAPGDVFLGDPDARRGHLLVHSAAGGWLPGSARRYRRAAVRRRRLLCVCLLATREGPVAARRRSTASAEPSPPPNILSVHG